MQGLAMDLTEIMDSYQALLDEKEDLVYSERNAMLDVIRYKERSESLRTRCMEKDEVIKDLHVQLSYFRDFFRGPASQPGHMTEQARLHLLQVKKEKELSDAAKRQSNISDVDMGGATGGNSVDTSINLEDDDSDDAMSD